MLKGTTAITHVTSNLVKLKEEDSRKKNQKINHLCHQKTWGSFVTLAKDVSIPSKWLFRDDINERINNIKAQQKGFKVDKTYFKPESTFDGQACFPKKKLKNWEISKNSRK